MVNVCYAPDSDRKYCGAANDAMHNKGQMPREVAFLSAVTLFSYPQAIGCRPEYT